MSGLKMSQEELIYIARFYEVDGPVIVSAALERSFDAVAKRYRRMKLNGDLERYRSMWDEVDMNKSGR